MGTYVTFKAKPGMEDEINQEFARVTGKPNDFLVYSDAVIRDEIAFIRSPEGNSQSHLRPYLTDVDSWNRMFPICKSGTNQIKISGYEESDKPYLRKVFAFIIEHRSAFAEITGLDDAATRGLCTLNAEKLVDGQPVKVEHEKEPSFDAFPDDGSQLYKLCVKHQRADLWAALMHFERDSNDTTWSALRTKTVPWQAEIFCTVWQLCERAAEQADGQSFGLMGRFRDGTVPNVDMLREVLGDHPKQDPAPDMEDPAAPQM